MEELFRGVDSRKGADSEEKISWLTQGTSGAQAIEINTCELIFGGMSRLQIFSPHVGDDLSSFLYLQFTILIVLQPGYCS